MKLFTLSPRPVSHGIRVAAHVAALGVLLASVSCRAQAADSKTPVDALVYSTMPSTAAHRPEMVMDGDANTYFKSAYGMDDGDDLLILFTGDLSVESFRITTGNTEGDDLLTDGYAEISTDGVTYTKAATFNAQGIAEAKLGKKSIRAIRIKLNPRKGLPTLLVREIEVKSSTPVAHVLYGPGRGFVDISQAPDLKVWADKAEKQMESFWADTAALLYTDKFITPNKVNVIYKTGPDVTPVAATGGGVMTVNSAWCRAHPEDTGLTVHETAHAIQSMSAYDPVWLIEGIADYVRWVKFEPENYKVRINPATATYHDSYRTTATFLAWCELHYDSKLATKLNHATRVGNFKIGMFKEYCGKDVDTLWAEFIAAYKADPENIITPPIAEADRPRTLPTVKTGSSMVVTLTSEFNATGIYKDGATFGETDGFDAGGAAYSGTLLTANVNHKDVIFQVGAAGAPNIIAARGNTINLPAGTYNSLWLLAAAVEGNQMAQEFTVTYTDGSTERLAQNISDWFQPQGFPGESRAVKMPYRILGNGRKDPRPFFAYSYGFKLNSTKTVKSVTLPNNEKVKVLGITLAN